MTKKSTIEKEYGELIKKLTLLNARKLRSIGIPVSTQIDDVIINTRAKSRLGACKLMKTSQGKKSFTIEISSETLKCSVDKITEVVIHELLHTCPGCFNHGKKWKSYGEKVYEKLGYRITRVTKYEELGLAKPVKKQETVYTVKCKGCGQIYTRKRMCPLVKNPENYKCGKCGSSLYFQGKSTTSCR